MTSDSQLMDSRDVDSTEENENAKEDVAEQWEKGYDLPIDEPERKEAEDECKMILELISDIYTQADKGEAVNTVLDDKTIYKMQYRIKEKGLNDLEVLVAFSGEVKDNDDVFTEEGMNKDKEGKTIKEKALPETR